MDKPGGKTVPLMLDPLKWLRWTLSTAFALALISGVGRNSTACLARFTFPRGMPGRRDRVGLWVRYSLRVIFNCIKYRSAFTAKIGGNAQLCKIFFGGMGKRGGLRVIHFVRYEPNEFWMLTIYAKAKRDEVPAHILKQLLEAFRNG